MKTLKDCKVDRYIEYFNKKVPRMYILTLFYGVESLPAHANNRTASHEREQRRKEWFIDKIAVVSFQ